jgi:hypothetical protein
MALRLLRALRKVCEGNGYIMEVCSGRMAAPTAAPIFRSATGYVPAGARDGRATI